jgi:hypothetical protein
MGRRYTAALDALSVSAVCELFNVIAPADAVVAIHEVSITQDAGETSEQLPVRIFRTATDQSAKGSANTPSPLEVGDAAFGGTVRTNVLTAETFATETTMLFCQSQNVLNGWHWLWTPETRPILSPSGKLCVKLDAAPAAALTFSGYVVVEEIGG